jgi:Ca2+-binding EF-hand superfamily protein
MTFVDSFLATADSNASPSRTTGPADGSSVAGMSLSSKQEHYGKLFLDWNFSTKASQREQRKHLLDTNCANPTLSRKPAEHQLPVRNSQLHRKRTLREIEKEADELFAKFDRDGNNTLDLIEFKKLLREAGIGAELNFRDFSKYAKRDFSTVDSDGDNAIDINEFKKYYLAVHSHNVVKSKSSMDKSTLTTETKRKKNVLIKAVRDPFRYIPPAARACWFKQTMRSAVRSLASRADCKPMSLDEVRLMSCSHLVLF